LRSWGPGKEKRFMTLRPGLDRLGWSSRCFVRVHASRPEGVDDTKVIGQASHWSVNTRNIG
jgi:hypothetical protein